MSVTINTNRKSHTVFRILPTSVTLDDLERRNCPYFALFYRIHVLYQVYYVTEVEDKIYLVCRISSSTFGHN